MTTAAGSAGSAWEVRGDIPDHGPPRPAAERSRQIAVTPRPLSDYRDMFLLSAAELTTGPLLDCPGGGSPFGAQVRARGGTVVSVDPVYRSAPAEVAGLLQDDLAQVALWVRAHPEHFDWERLGNPAAHARYFELAAEAFLLDYARRREWYVAAALPCLPFADGAFALSLSSHLLFCSPDHPSYADHLAALGELVRVTSGEVRVFPLVDAHGERYPHLARLVDDLRERGVHSRVRRAAVSFVRGGGELLTCRRE